MAWTSARNLAVERDDTMPDESYVGDEPGLPQEIVTAQSEQTTTEELVRKRSKRLSIQDRVLLQQGR